VKHIRGNFLYIYSITVNQVMVATVKLNYIFCGFNLKSCTFMFT